MLQKFETARDYLRKPYRAQFGRIFAISLLYNNDANLGKGNPDEGLAS